MTNKCPTKCQTFRVGVYTVTTLHDSQSGLNPRSPKSFEGKVPRGQSDCRSVVRETFGRLTAPRVSGRVYGGRDPSECGREPEDRDEGDLKV